MIHSNYWCFLPRRNLPSEVVVGEDQSRHCLPHLQERWPGGGGACARERAPGTEPDELEACERGEPGERGEERVGGEGVRERNTPRHVVWVTVAADREPR